MEPIKCDLAFGSVNVVSNNSYTICCVARDSVFTKKQNTRLPHIDKINIEPLREVRRSLINGEFHPACSNCQESEKLSSISLRTIWNNALEKYNIPITEFVDPKDMRYLSYAFGNKCNSKCMMCGPASSDLWTDEFTKIWAKTQRIRLPLVTPPTQIHKDSISEMLDTYPNLEHITLLGGEPTIIEEHVFMLETLISQNKSKNIELSYVTNLTGINDELINLWSNFKSVGFNVSIDGFDKVNEYVRYPFKWNKTDINLRTILQHSKDNKSKFSVSLSATLNLYNCIDMGNLIEYWFNVSKEYDNLNSGILITRVVQPDYTNLNISSVEHRQKGKQKLVELLDKIKKEPNINPSYEQNINLVLGLLDEPKTTNELLINDAKYFITESDKYRNRNIKDFIPELYNDLFKDKDNVIRR